MKLKVNQEFPPGWNEKKTREVIAHYDQQTDEEAAAEIESAPEVGGHTWLAVPAELVQIVTRLIKDHERKAVPARPSGRAKKTRSTKTSK